VGRKTSFLAFYLMWADRMRWTVPDVHVIACHWLEHRGDLAVLRCFRGFGKSTILAVYNAWRYYEDQAYRILHQSEADGTAYKTSRDTQNVIRRHPLTSGLLPSNQGTVEQWWVIGSTDHRNASMYAKGILSNVTSARADECQNDDVEVPRNIQTPEAREKLRYRLGEQTHILVPGGRKLYIGTPHTHDSLYDEMERLGADCLTIRMFEHEHRIENATEDRYQVPFHPEYVFSGIGKPARLMVEGVDYFVEEGNRVWFAHPPGALVDFYAGCAWPDRFVRAELEKRRRETRTINEWDSQYQLHSKPVTESRLDPEKMRPYEVQPVVERANRETRMMLGAARIVSARAYWDCATGKAGGDDSVVSLILDDAAGNYYWHVAQAMIGEFAVFAEDNARIAGGQVMQICDLIERYSIPQIYVETNGVGSFAPQLLRKAISQRRLHCGVLERTATVNKNEKILAGLEGPLRSGILWAHVDVLDGPVWDQMKQFNPLIKTQPDDYIDSGASAILETPVRIGKLVGNPTGDSSHDWRPSTGVHEVTLEM
jgi:hypothetical protein